MPDTEELIREYADILSQQRQLDERKKLLREQIMDSLKQESLTSAQTRFGTAQLIKRHVLTPRAEKILSMLSAQDMLPFARFTSKRVKELLVPKYGREKLLEVFDTQTVETLVVKAAHESRGDNTGVG